MKGKYKVKFSVSKSIDACVRQLLLALWSSPSPLRELDQSAGIVCGTNDGLDAFQMRLQREPEQRQGQHHDGQEGDVRDREPDLRPCQEVRSQGVSGNEDAGRDGNGNARQLQTEDQVPHHTHPPHTGRSQGGEEAGEAPDAVVVGRHGSEPAPGHGVGHADRDEGRGQYRARQRGGADGAQNLAGVPGVRAAAGEY